MSTKKKKYQKPQFTVKKLTPFFFNCLQNVNQCTSVVSNRTVGVGCPQA